MHTAPLPREDDLHHLAELLLRRRTVLLTGAGCSTESGIPDYRGPQTRHKKRNPLNYQDFIRKPEARQRYWARAVAGWDTLRLARPNATHHAVAALQQRGLLQGVITQNVDRLHHRAGSADAVELHGALEEVRCLQCSDLTSRDALQQRLLDANPGWLQTVAAQRAAAPDGDADLSDDLTATFQVLPCDACGGVLKPHVVFFGESVPADVTARAFDLLHRAEALLIAGTSLTVWSGFRFLHTAHQHGKPAAAINLGPLARGGDLLHLHLDAACGPTFQALLRVLDLPGP